MNWQPSLFLKRNSSISLRCWKRIKRKGMAAEERRERREMGVYEVVGVERGKYYCGKSVRREVRVERGEDGSGRETSRKW